MDKIKKIKNLKQELKIIIEDIAYEYRFSQNSIRFYQVQDLKGEKPTSTKENLYYIIKKELSKIEIMNNSLTKNKKELF